jgi:hypothetical protein
MVENVYLFKMFDEVSIGFWSYAVYFDDIVRRTLGVKLLYSATSWMLRIILS